LERKAQTLLAIHGCTSDMNRNEALSTLIGAGNFLRDLMQVQSMLMPVSLDTRSIDSSSSDPAARRLLFFIQCLDDG
jgi:hypothetical protein